MHVGDQHAVLVELFRRHPELAVSLIAGMPGVTLPTGCKARAVDPVIKFGSLVPDTIVELRDAEDVLRLTLILEAQRRIEAGKRESWAAALWNEHYRRSCDVYVLVVTASRRVAEWASTPIRCGQSMTQALVLGPGRVPRVTDPAWALLDPALAVLSAGIYAAEPEAHAIACAALAGVGRLPRHEASMYSHVITRTLPAAMIRQLKEDFMRMQSYDPPPIDFDDDGVVRDGYEVVIKPYVDRAIAEERGKRLLKIFTRIGIPVDDASRARILECMDVELLDEWLDLAFTAHSVDEVLALAWCATS